MKSKKATLIRVNDWDSIIAWDISRPFPNSHTYEFDYLIVEGANSVKARYIISNDKSKKVAMKAIGRIIDTYKDMRDGISALEFPEE